MKKPIIQVYKGELAVSGLADRVMSSSSLSVQNPLFCEKVNASTIDKSVISIKDAILSKVRDLAIAAETDKDLYITKSILVSTSWNKNDDVFSPAEVWKARYTPSHKPTNIEHDEKQLVGHITNVWAIDDESGEIIPDDTKAGDLPDFYHVANGAVIYLVWQNEDLQKRTADLIEKIEANDMFVSMECLFRDFDYAFMGESSSNFKTIARNDDTSWLTKHLRAYGGTGEYNGQRVGRLLKNITFCGKGYVEKPANPDSIIFGSQSKVFCFSKASYDDKLEEIEKREIGNIQNEENGVLSNNVNSNQGEDENMTVEQEKLEAQIKELQEKLEAANKTIADFNESKFTSQIEKLDKEVAELKVQVEAKDAQIKTKSEEVDTIKANLEKVEEVKANLEKEIQEVRAAEAQAKRVAKLVDGGVEKSRAEAKVELFKSLADEQFDAVAEEIIEAAKAKYDDKEKDKDKDKEKEKAKEEDDDEDDEAEGAENVEVEPEAAPSLSSSASTEGKEDPNAEARKELADLAIAHIAKVRNRNKKN